MNIDIVREIDDLHREIFSFWYSHDRMILYLDSYNLYSRQTKRHKYAIERFYDRLAGHWDKRKTNFVKGDDVPLTDDIKKQALAKFVSQIKVDIWPEDKK